MIMSSMPLGDNSYYVHMEIYLLSNLWHNLPLFCQGPYKPMIISVINKTFFCSYQSYNNVYKTYLDIQFANCVLSTISFQFSDLFSFFFTCSSQTNYLKVKVQRRPKWHTVREHVSLHLWRGFNRNFLAKPLLRNVKSPVPADMRRSNTKNAFA